MGESPLHKIALPEKDKAEKFDLIHKEFIEMYSKYYEITESDQAKKLLNQLCEDFFEIIFGYKKKDIKWTIEYPDITRESRHKSYIHYKNLIKKGYSELDAFKEAMRSRKVKRPITDLNKKAQREMTRLIKEGLGEQEAARKAFNKYFASELEYSNHAWAQIRMGKKAYDVMESERLEKISKKINSIRSEYKGKY